MTALLHIGSSDAPFLAHLRGSGIDVRSSAAEPFDVVVIDPDVHAPLQLARKLRHDAPDAHIVFLTTPETDPVLRRELLVGRIGTQWSIAPADRPGAAADVVREAIAGTERRRRLRTTLGRLNMHLVQPPPAAPRRALISDHFLASVLDQLSDAVVVLDPSGGVLAYNGAAARAFGNVRRGAPFGEALPPAAREAILASAHAPHGQAEAVLVAPESGIEYSLRATSLREADARPIGIALVARDVSAGRKEERRRKLVSDAVRVLASTLEVKTALQRLVELLVGDFADVAASDIIEGDHMSRYAVAGRSPRQAELMERSRGFDVGRNRHHPSLAALARGGTVVQNNLDQEMLAQLASSKEHFELLRELRPHAVAVAPLRGGDDTIGTLLVGRTSGFPFSRGEVDTIEEIARQAATAMHNIWSYHAAAQANRLKDEFLATLSHELRTPITSILGWAQILRLDDGNVELLRDGLESIERSARAQAQLIDDLLDLSRMQMGKLQFQAGPFSLSAVVRAAVDTVRPAAQAKNVALSIEAEAEVVVTGDPDRMQQVIWNLLSNAVKFSDAGSEVHIVVKGEGRHASVAVTDQGRGIPPEFLPHVFDRFRQADAATTRRYGGLGLGLAIVKQLVELHGGTVTAASRGTGHGATFTVRLPLARAGQDQSHLPRIGAVQMSDLTGLQLLVVEDEPASARILTGMLERAGADVRTVGSAAAALDAVRDELPDVLLSDIGMPDEDGLSLIRSIRGTLRIPAARLPAIAITAFSDPNLRATLLAAGFQRFLRKPVDAETLAQTVAALAPPLDMPH